MKKVLSTLFACALTFSITTNAFAHTHLTGATPEDGATVEEAINSLTLSFDGKVGEGSYVELTSSSGENIAVQSINIDDKEMVATLAAPLENDEYTVDWSIISADGHPLEGSYAFTVNAPIEQQDQEVTTQQQNNSVDINTTTDQQDEETSSTGILVIAIILAIIIIISLITLLRRKK